MATTFSGKMTPIEVDIWLSERIDSINTQIGSGDYTGALQAISDLQNSISGFATEAYVDARTGMLLRRDKANILTAFTNGSQSNSFELKTNKLHAYVLEVTDENTSNVFSGTFFTTGLDNEADFSFSHAYYNSTNSTVVFYVVKHEGEETEAYAQDPGAVAVLSAKLTIYEMR